MSVLNFSFTDAIPSAKNEEDIYNLINSKDIANHLCHIGYKFTSIEVAWLIWQSRHLDLSQRHTAWREVISCMPDCKLDATERHREIPSLHKYLKNLIAAQEDAKKSFFEAAPDSYFNGEVRGKSFDAWDPAGFSTFDACIAHLDAYESDPESILYYRISKFKLIQKEYEEEITVIFDCNGQIRDIHTVHFQNIFTSLYFDFPVPFKKGDILVRSSEGIPTLADSGYWAKVVYLSHGVDKEKQLATFEDMTLNGYFFRGMSELSRGSEGNYMDFELARDKLVSTERVLAITSELLKNRLDVVEYAEMYYLIKLENKLAEQRTLREMLDSL